MSEQDEQPGRTYVLAHSHAFGVQWCAEHDINPHSRRTMILVNAQDCWSVRLHREDRVFRADPDWSLLHAWEYVEWTSGRTVHVP